MTVPHRLFLDANVWFAAAASAAGASAMLLSLCQEGHCAATVTRLILREAEKNLQAKAKFRDAALVRFYRLIAAPGLQVIAAPSPGRNRTLRRHHPCEGHPCAGRGSQGKSYRVNYPGPKTFRHTGDPPGNAALRDPDTWHVPPAAGRAITRHRADVHSPPGSLSILLPRQKGPTGTPLAALPIVPQTSRHPHFLKSTLASHVPAVRQEPVANMTRESPVPFSQELAADSACIRTWKRPERYCRSARPCVTV